MTPAAPVLTAVTLGVRDLARSVRFYESLGFVRKVRATGDEIAFFDAGGTAIALWGAEKLAADAACPAPSQTQAFFNTTLAWNLRTDGEVDEAFARGIAAGGKALRRPEPTDYGGYRGYFADPDGHVWEVVRAPGFAFTADGRLALPD